jgi:hypothetical protein
MRKGDTLNMRTQNKVTIGVASEFCVIGYDGEYADMDNPRGAIVREVFFLVAEDARGARWAWGEGWRDADAAEAAIATAPPVILWSPWRPAYGSVAYIEDGGEEEMVAWEARHREAEEWGFDTRYGAY